MRWGLLNTTSLVRNVPDAAAGAPAAAPAPVVDAAAGVAAAPNPAADAAASANASPAAVDAPAAGPIVDAAAAAAAEPAKLDAHSEPTLLEQAGIDADKAKADADAAAAADPAKVDPTKPAEAAKTPEQLAADAAAAAADPAKAAADAAKAAEPVKYEAFVWPEGIKVDETVLGKATETLSKIGVKQEDAQHLLTLHAEQMQTWAEKLVADQHKAWSETRKGWRDQVLADEQLGGAGHQTAMQAVARARDMFVGDKDKAEFETFLRTTGAGDNPAFLRFLHNVARWSDEPVAPSIQGGPSKLNGSPGGKQGMRSLYKSSGN